jgi:subtilisin family serine protease
VHPANLLSFHRRIEAEENLAAVAAELARLTRNHPEAVELEEVVWTINALALRTHAKVIADLAHRDDVQAIVADRTLALLAPRRPSRRRGPASWGIPRVGADKVWAQMGASGEGAVIGHVDTGADGSHPDLKGKVVAFRDYTKWNAPRGEPYDDEGHGTHTAGTIAGASASGAPIGVAPKSRLIVAKALNKNGAGGLVGLMRALKWMCDPDGSPATHDQPLAVSNSWGAPLMAPVINRMFWLSVSSLRGAGVVPVFAAGNEGEGKLDIPGAYPHALAVGATTERDQIADFSSRGTVRWGTTTYQKPDVSGPGEDIYSSLPGGKWGYESGTSMATPHVAGAIALVWSANPHLSSAQVEKIIQESAHDLGSPGRDAVFGYGLLDLVKASERARASSGGAGLASPLPRAELWPDVEPLAQEP